MTETATEKNRGLKFAEQQLLRHGWEQGKGLGKSENGISEAIRVKVKCDKGGVGHKESEQFTFHWWDHVFNKASANLAVESDQNGVLLKKMEEEDGMVSNKKPRKALMSKSMLYGCFVKSATLLSGHEQPEVKLSGSEDSSSEDEEKLDLSSTKNLSDVQLMKACGGRTAHKGARHGLTMSAKLARLEQQEQEFMAKYGKKKQTTPEAIPERSSSLDQERAEKTEQKKNKKKKQKSDEPKENGTQDNSESSQEHNEEMSKKRKKRSKDKRDFESQDAGHSFVDPKIKKKKTKLVKEEKSTEMQEEITEHQSTEDCFSKKKKKKKNHCEKSTAQVSEESAEKTVCHEHEQHEEGTAALHPAPDACKKKKKEKSSKANKDKSPATEMDICCSLDISTAEKVLSLQSQSKKRKSREDALEAETENRAIKKTSEKKKKKKKHTE